MPNTIEITDEDIQIAGERLGLELESGEILAVLKEKETCDVQAGPGSGKTSVLTAKLAVLARKWPSHDRGICVLSHTNVARREIEKKLSQSAELRQLLAYPHYVGTIQTFVDQFLAIPYIRREKIEVAAIDNDRFGSRAWGMFCKNARKERFGLEKRYASSPERARYVVENLRFDGARMAVVHPMTGVGNFPGALTNTGKALIAVKESLRKEGYFRFDDMFAFAEACLQKVPYVAPALRLRFPWVFVDELQDTSPIQERIIEQLFAGSGCIYQRFGDKNQAIFDFDGEDSDTPSLFGVRKTLFLNTTHRFGARIASIVSRFSAVEPQRSSATVSAVIARIRSLYSTGLTFKRLCQRSATWFLTRFLTTS